MILLIISGLCFLEVQSPEKALSSSRLLPTFYTRATRRNVQSSMVLFCSAVFCSVGVVCLQLVFCRKAYQKEMKPYIMYELVEGCLNYLRAVESTGSETKVSFSDNKDEDKKFHEGFLTLVRKHQSNNCTASLLATFVLFDLFCHHRHHGCCFCSHG